MDAQIKINTDDLIAKFGKMDYSKLNDTFRQAISDALEILKRQAQSNLAATGYNINAPVHGNYHRTYSPMSSGIQKEVSLDGTKGRVRIAAASRKDYGLFDGPGSYVLKWFELGTEQRYRKSNKYSSSYTKIPTGKIRATHFFDRAYTSTADAVNKKLEDSVNKAINEIMNK